MEKINFIVEENTERGLIVKGLNVSIYTETDSIEELKIAVRDALSCHFDDDIKRIILLKQY